MARSFKNDCWNYVAAHADDEVVLGPAVVATVAGKNYAFRSIADELEPGQTFSYKLTQDDRSQEGEALVNADGTVTLLSVESNSEGTQEGLAFGDGALIALVVLASDVTVPTQEEAEAGVLETGRMTPERTKQHVDSRIADTPTSIAGVSTDTVLSPSGGREFVEAKIADQPTAEAGESETTLLSPKGGRQQRDHWAGHSPLFPRTNGFYSNDIYGDTDAPGDTANIIRAADRLFVGAAADIKGTKHGWKSGEVPDSSYVATLGLLYLDRQATFAAYSPNGGSGAVFASRVSRKRTHSIYGALDKWASGESVSTGDWRVWMGRIYEATTTGTTGATPPTHTSGTASDDTVTWQFVDQLYMTTISLASIIDVNDDNMGNGWGVYVDGTRSSNNVLFGAEWAIKEKGSNVVLNPYSTFGGTIGNWFAGGGDANTGGSPANPSTVAIYIGPNASTWNSGIIFKDGFGTDLGSGEMQAIVFPRSARLDWYFTGGTRGLSILSAVNQSASQQRFIFGNAATTFNNNVNIPLFQVEVVSGTVTGYLRAAASVSALPTIIADGSATDIDIRLLPKGAGLLRTAIANVPNHADDAAAQAGGVPVGGIYRNGSVLMIRAA